MEARYPVKTCLFTMQTYLVYLMHFAQKISWGNSTLPRLHHEHESDASGLKKFGGFVVIKATPLSSRVVAISNKALKAG
ncbi:MAG: hypothetical protein V3U79_06705 [Dehalococcoidia bacterium]